MTSQDNLVENLARRVTRGKENMPTRRRYQQGYLYKRGKKQKLWIGRWREDVIQPNGSRGRKQRSVVLGPVSEIRTRREAQALLEQHLRPMNLGITRPNSTMSFASFALEDWTKLNLPSLKPSTQHSYRVAIRRHLVPYFGDSRLSDISRLEIQRFVTEMFADSKAWQTVRNIWIVLSSILKAAVEYGYLDENPASRVRFPPQPPPQERRVLTGDEIQRLLEEPCKTMAILVLLTGLRIGEVLAIRWGSVDLITGSIRISQFVSFN
jgi:hypothetical protein